LELTSPLIKIRGRRGRDCMVVGFTTNYAISVHHHWRCEKTNPHM